MKLIIDIDKDTYKRIKGLVDADYFEHDINGFSQKAIANGTPIPDSATNERMVGSWIKSRDSYGTNHFTCPFCEHDIATRNANNWDDNYCSNCGARMVRKENNNADISN